MLKRCALFLLLLCPVLGAADPAALVQQALAAEARLDSVRALELFREADAARAEDPFVLQKIARQYSDLVVDQDTPEAKKRYAEMALGYAQRAKALQPDDPVNVLSVAVCYGKLAAYSDTRTKVQYSRLIKDAAERALELDSSYAWAHHVLGRWHYEVATLGRAAKFFVQLIHGGLPDATLDQGIRHLRRATELEPTELNHFLELGFAHAAAQQPAEARARWTQGLALPSRGKHDEPAKQRAREGMARLR
jgi:hypothetical protein